jgi:hypothetical protein
MLKFDQLAVQGRTRRAALLAMGGWAFPVRDVVTAVGRDAAGQRIRNVAELAFCYDMWPGNLEYEVLFYREGWNWMESSWGNTVANVQLSHYGVHVGSRAEMDHITGQFYGILQEVVTVHHANPACADRRYHYRILDAEADLGCAVKLIRRLTLEQAEAVQKELLEGA